jgi:hypothetical protein
MPLVMVINQGDFVMISADRSVAMSPDDDLFCFSTSKIVETPFGMAVTYGDPYLGKMTRDRLVSSEVAESSQLQAMILGERMKFINELPEEDLRDSGVIVTYTTVGSEGPQTRSQWLQPLENNEELTDTRISATCFCGSLEKKINGDQILLKLHTAVEKINTNKSLASRIRQSAKLLAKLNKKMSKNSLDIAPGCEIAVQLNDNSVWSCKHIEGAYRLVDF